jgi:hypothetical protein
MGGIRYYYTRIDAPRKIAPNLDLNLDLPLLQRWVGSLRGRRIRLPRSLWDPYRFVTDKESSRFTFRRVARLRALSLFEKNKEED